MRMCDVMRTKIVLVFFEALTLGVAGCLAVVLLTGGFSASIGPVRISAHSVQRLTIMLAAALLARRMLAGVWWSNFVIIKGIRRFSEWALGRVAASRTLRKWAIVGVGALAGSLLLTSLLDPLESGLTVSYYDNPDWAGSPSLRIHDRSFSLPTIQQEVPSLPETYSIQWHGVIYAPVSGTYHFGTASDDGSEILLNDQRIVDNRGLHGHQERTGAIELSKGFHQIDIRYMQGGGAASFDAHFSLPDKGRQMLSAALTFAEEPTTLAFWAHRLCGVVVVIGWSILAALAGCVVIAVLAGWRIVGPWIGAPSWRRWGRHVMTRLLGSEQRTEQVSLHPRQRWRGAAFAVAGYTLLSMLITYPLARDFFTQMAGLGGDRYIYLWNMWWMKRALIDLRTNPLFTEYLFYPRGLSLAFHDFSLLLTGLSLPLQPVFSLQEIYNLFYLLSYVLSGLGVFLLVRFLTGDQRAAFVAGVIYGFWGGRAFYSDHLYLASIQWMPYAVLFLLKTLRERSLWNPALAALFLVANALTSWYYAIFLSLFVALFLGYYAWTERRIFFTRDVLLRFALALTIFAIVMAPVLVPMLADIARGEGYMNTSMLINESISLHTLFLPNANHQVFGPALKQMYESLGIPLQWGLPGGSFLTFSLLGLCVYAWKARARLRSQFWLLAFGAFVVLSLGPYLQVFSGEVTDLPLPYLALKRLPVLKSMRAASRFMVMAMLGGGVAAGLACHDIFSRIRRKNALCAGLIALFLFESLRGFAVRPVEAAPPFYAALRNDSEEYAVMELTPLTETSHSARRASLFQIQHQKKLCNGFSARVPFDAYYDAFAVYPMIDDRLVVPPSQLDESAEVLRRLLFVDAEAMFEILSFLDIRYVMLYSDYWDGGDYAHNRDRLRAVFGPPVGEERGMSLFRVPARAGDRNLAYPGVGLSRLKFDEALGGFYREARQRTEMKVIAQQAPGSLQLRWLVQPLTAGGTADIYLNAQRMATFPLTEGWNDLRSPRMELQPGENTVTVKFPPVIENTYGDVKAVVREIEIQFFKHSS